MTTEEHDKQSEHIITSPAVHGETLNEESNHASKGPGVESKEAAFEPICKRDQEELMQIAGAISHNYLDNLKNGDTVDGLSTDDPRLDPANSSFEPHLWAESMFRVLNSQGFHPPRVGAVFKNLTVSGAGPLLASQETVGSILTVPLRHSTSTSAPRRELLHGLHGILNCGELLMVLGSPGSGCSTFLKTICGQLGGLQVCDGSILHYNGISMQEMLSEYSGALVYNQDVDKHIPQLTVRQTLEFAAAARTPSCTTAGVKPAELVKRFVQVVMVMFGLSTIAETSIGNDHLQGISSGERKRLSLAEVALSRAQIAGWDNSSRGLDAACALLFISSMQMMAKLTGGCHAVALQQSSEAIYRLFDKVILIYEGREIYYGRCDTAKEYFTRMGWYCSPRQATADYLKSITDPQQRQPCAGMEAKVPRSPEEFERYWKESPEFASLQQEIEEQEAECLARRPPKQDSPRNRWLQLVNNSYFGGTPYMMNIWRQVVICAKRAYQRSWGDRYRLLTLVIGRIVMALVIGSCFYDTPSSTAGTQSRASVIFLSVAMNALMNLNEINSYFELLPVIEKHTSYAFIRPFADGIGGLIIDIPTKFMAGTLFNLVLYFLAGLRREPSQFFIFLLFQFQATLVMSAVFRTLGATSKVLPQAMTLAAAVVTMCILYMGFVIPVPLMRPWFGWIRWLNPMHYVYEALVANEFHGQQLKCAAFVPAYQNLTGDTFVCSAIGAMAGHITLSGDAFIHKQYNFTYDHLWRNLGITIAFWICILVGSLVASELNSGTASIPGSVLFPRDRIASHKKTEDEAIDQVMNAPRPDISCRDGQVSVGEQNIIAKHPEIFTWQNLCCDVVSRGRRQRLLMNISGWAQPGTLTAIMGVSGAGKSILLNALAQRAQVGIVTGTLLMNGRPLDATFPRKMGYIQHQDPHLPTSTVREALCFSAFLRQPRTVSKEEKRNCVEQLIRILSLEDFADAVIGIPGQGLPLQQRKLLTLGVELAAKPALLLLDEPTSWLDAQTSIAMYAVLRNLANQGLAVITTLHQPSETLFQQFDQLLLLAKGGEMVYFGDIGEDSCALLGYFERHGARRCHPTENPAEYILETISADTEKAEQDWPALWRSSAEAKHIQTEIAKVQGGAARQSEDKAEKADTTGNNQFAMPFRYQLFHVTRRAFQQYWREPQFVYVKFLFQIATALVIGFSAFKPVNTQQGFQEVLYGTLNLMGVFVNLVQQRMPKLIAQRSLYELQEQPSRTYSWVVFLIANIIVEIPYQVFLAVLVWPSFYFPIYGANQPPVQQGLMLMFLIQLCVFSSTMADLIVAPISNAEVTGASIAFILIFLFNGVLQPPSALPRFWRFMYYASPLTYSLSGMAGVGLHSRTVHCAESEFNVFNPPPGQTCGEYLAQYLQGAPGKLYNPSAVTNCKYCPLTTADQFLATMNIYYSERWRNWGVGWAYIGFNICGAVVLYYMFRVRRYNPFTLIGGIIYRHLTPGEAI